MPAARLFHIAPAAAQQMMDQLSEYRPPTFAREGFVHCSYAWQVCAVANRLFHGRHDLVLIEIDPAKLSSKVVDENLEGGIELYPHVYGALPASAVVQVHPLPCGADGRFEMPVGYDSSPPG